MSAGTLPAVRMRLSAPMCLSVPPAPGITLWWGSLAENVLQNLIYCVSQDSQGSPGITLWWGLLAETVLQNLIYCVSQGSQESSAGCGA